MNEIQLSLFDIMSEAARVEEPAPRAQEAPRRCQIAATGKCAAGGYHVFGDTLETIDISGWTPDAQFMVERFPIFDYYVTLGRKYPELFSASDIIDVWVHEVDKSGKALRMLADAHHTISAGEIIVALAAQRRPTIST